MSAGNVELEMTGIIYSTPHLQCTYSKSIDVSSSGLSGSGQLWSSIVETICLLSLRLDMLVDGVR